MATRIDSLEKKLAKLEAEAAETKKQLRAQKQLDKAKETERKRKADTRRKILLGGFVLAKKKQGDTQAQAYHDELVASLDSEKDKALFTTEDS